MSSLKNKNQTEFQSGRKPRLLMPCLLCLLFVLAYACTCEAKNTLSWNGSISDDWNIAGNWSPHIVPGAADDVQIGIITFNNNNQPTVRNVLQCATLTLGSRQPILLTISSGASLTVSGSVTLAHSEDNMVPDATITGGGNLTCNSLILGNGVPSKIVAVKTSRLISTLANFTVTGNVYINSTTSWLLSGGIAHNNSLFSLQGGQITVGGQVLLTNLVPLFLTTGLLNLKPSAAFRIDVSSGQSPRLKVLGQFPISINNPVWDTVDYYKLVTTGNSTVEYGGSNQIITTSSTSGLDTIPQPYDNLVISGSGIKTTESASGDYLTVAGFLNITQGTLDMQTNSATLGVWGNFSNAATVKLAKATFAGGVFTNSNVLSTGADTIRFSGGSQALNDSTSGGTAMNNVIFATGNKRIVTGKFVVPTGGTWKMANDSAFISVAPNAALIFKPDSTGHSVMIFKSAYNPRPPGLGVMPNTPVFAVLNLNRIFLNNDWRQAGRVGVRRDSGRINPYGKPRRPGNTRPPRLSRYLRMPALKTKETRVAAARRSALPGTLEEINRKYRPALGVLGRLTGVGTAKLLISFVGGRS